jgi:fused signal recognition particle receptor
MAFGFIKKVFSFGRKAEDEQDPQGAAPVSDGLQGQPTLAPYVGIADRPAPQPDTAADAPSLPEADVLSPIREPDPVSGLESRGDLAPEPTSIPAPAAIVPAAVAPSPATAEPGRSIEPAPAAEILPPIRVPDPVATRPVEAEIARELPVVTDGPGAAVPVPAAPVQQPAPAAAGAEPQPTEPPQAVLAPAAPVDAGTPRQPEEQAPPVPEPTAKVAADAAGVEPSPPADVVHAKDPAPAPRQPSHPAATGKVTVAKKVEVKAEPVAPAAPAPRTTWFQRMREGLARSSRELSSSIAGVFTRKKLDEDTLQELEEVLIRADLGVETALRITDTLASTRLGRDVSDVEVRAVMAQEIEKVLKPVALPLELDLSHKPHVILVVGVNGTGKTTTIGKLSAKLTEGGLDVMLAAGDTFRAAAIEQLRIWGERTKSPVIASKLGADAAGLAYDAFARAKEAGSDVLIIDTAGRLQNKAELMAELEKIVRVLGKLDPEAPHTVLQTVDATTGQNALNQVEIFRNVAGVNGLVMTKLDGTARGGILVAIAAKHKLPVYFIGVGEQVDDLEPFSANDFARAIAGVP